MLPPTSCTTDSILRLVSDGVRVSIRLTPRAAADRIIGIANGVLKVAVTAPPAENRANDALVRFLAREWRIPQRDLSIAAGHRSRDKTILIRGEPGALMARLGPLLRVTVPARR